MIRRRLHRNDAPAATFWLALHSSIAITLLAALTMPTKAQVSSADEYEIRAAMLLNLTRFIDWPSLKLDPAHPQFVICIAGPDPIGPAADRYLRNQNVDGKPVQVMHLTSLQSANNCHILYVSASERKNVERVLPELMKSGVLTISERSNTVSLNQVIGLPTLDEHVSIEVNLAAAQRTGLIISSKLLRLATVTR